jgi:hypothetical protein
MAIWAAGLALGPSPLPAQSAPAPTTNTPATDTVGPKELQNFSLSGTVTKPAEPAQTSAPATTGRAAKQPRTHAVSTISAPAGDRRAAQAVPKSAPPVQIASNDVPQPASGSPEPPHQTIRSPAVTVAAPVPAAAGFAPEPASATGTLGPEHGLPLWPWLFAALALAAGSAFLFWRNRSYEAFAGGPQIDLFTSPEPAPSPPSQPRAPQRAPAPVSPPVASPAGVVSTRLRPWVEVAMQPLRCIVEEAQVIFEFELDLFNSGNAPARAVLVEASVFNAGPNQDQDIGAFFGQPIGEGERIDAIPPLQRMTLRTQVVAPRENVQVLDIADRQVFVPLIAFNALYRRSGGEGQTSVAYLLGRDTKAEKLAPFRLDLGPRIFRGVGARPLPMGVRN